MTPTDRVRASRQFHDAWMVLVLYLLATVLTSAYFMGDTVDYAKAIVARTAGQDYFFWEFGHLLWRPLGFLLFSISGPLTRMAVGPEGLAGATLVLICLSWLAGLLSVLSLYGILRRICRNRWSVVATNIAFIFAQAFLNYFHSGAPYIPGLGLVLFALYLLVAREDKDKPPLWTAALAGVALAGAVLLWFPFALALPAALVAPILLFGLNKQRVTTCVAAVLAGAIIGGAVYFSVMAHIGIHNVHDFGVWVEKTSRSSGSPNKGLSRMVFGFARSFINMGNDGMLFKRFLLHDPFNPVSAWDLVRMSLWKLLAFYLFLLFLFLNLITSAPNRRMLALLIVNVAPVIAFAIYWQGGDPERYLPLYPLLFISLAWVFDTKQKRPVLKLPLIFFVATMVLTNAVMMSRSRLNGQQEAAAARIRPLVLTLKPESWLITANWQDDLVNFNRSFPLNPINRSSNLRIGSLITPGEPDVAYWQRSFAERVQSAWVKGGDVWISRRLFSPQPQADWNWVEGDDRRVSWSDLYRYASRLELGQSVGGDDGFVLLVPGEQNRRVMSEGAPAINR